VAKTPVLVAGVFALLAVLLTAKVGAEPTARIAIIIDDLGYQLEAGRRAIRLPGPVGYAVLPGTPRGRQLAESAHSRGKEVLLHLPLQAVGQNGPEEPGSITLDMSREMFRSTFAAALASVPFAIGVNSHRGSLLTRHPGHMRWLMEEIGDRQGLFFIDSYTTHESVALQVANEMQVAAIKRDVFLDSENTPEAIAQEFERLKLLARERGSAVAIGHPYPATLALLERELPGLRDEGFELVAISEILQESTGRPELQEAWLVEETAIENSDVDAQALENRVELTPPLQF
jgi:polysaccharide deacetylase 2 family uncharacterized protein YibQ